MVPINELRTGNKLLFDNRVVEVMSIHRSGRIFSYPGGYIDVLELTSIPLNKEWLLDFGFEELHNGLFRFRQLTEVFHILNEFFFRYDGKIIASCKCVHELQNLFFALYKEELNSGSSAFFELNEPSLLEGDSFIIEKKPAIQIV
jgi:hypothetical protein